MESQIFWKPSSLKLFIFQFLSLSQKHGLAFTEEQSEAPADLDVFPGSAEGT